MSTLFVDNLKPNLNTGINIPGHIIQVVDSGSASTTITVQNTTFTDTTLQATISPKFATSKILVTASQDVQVWNTSNYATGRWRIMRNIDGGSFTAIYQDHTSSNGNVFAYDYGGSGINIYHPISYTMTDSPSTTSPCIYKTQICQGSNGGNRCVANQGSPARMILMEIGQ